MSYFEDLKLSLKDQWLDYYEANISWIKYLMDNDGSWYSTVDQGNIRPNTHFILGVVISLNSELQEMMLTLSQLNADEDKLLEVLGLDFDPEIELEKREEKRANNLQFNYSDTDEIERIRQQLQKGEV